MFYICIIWGIIIGHPKDKKLSNVGLLKIDKILQKYNKQSVNQLVGQK